MCLIMEWTLLDYVLLHNRRVKDLIPVIIKRISEHFETEIVQKR